MSGRLCKSVCVWRAVPLLLLLLLNADVVCCGYDEDVNYKKSYCEKLLSHFASDENASTERNKTLKENKK